MLEDPNSQAPEKATTDNAWTWLKPCRNQKRSNTLFFLLGMAAAVVIIILIFNTPLRNYLPGYLDVNKRAMLMESAMRIDSLVYENNLRSAYLENVKAVLNDRVESDSLQSFDSAVSIMQDTLLAPSARELAFAARYEEQERFGLTELGVDAEVHTTVNFLTPVKGKVIPPSNEDMVTSGITQVELTHEMPVLAPREGNVISLQYLIGSGYFMVIQHDNEYISQFTHLASVMVDLGQPLKAGQVIGHAKEWVGIQLWHRGKSADPIALMSLE